jgi:hypothetical protein
MQMVGGRDRDRTGDPLLAKQVLSQLSYTPTVGVNFILKHFRARRNPFLRTLVKTVPKLFQNPVYNGKSWGMPSHFVGYAVDLVQRFTFHLQLHVRILLEHLGVALT